MATSQWHSAIPAVGNVISSDVPNMEDNFEELERILETITNGTLGSTDTDDYKIDTENLDINSSASDGDLLQYDSSTSKPVWSSAETVPEVQLDISNAPTDGYRLAYNSTSGKMEWIVAGTAANDTGAVRMNAGDSMDYVDTKLGIGIENISDTINIQESYLKKFLGL
ncbi:MAG: hypothetical protein SVY53_09270 [Chloroflexota bacterium]|nr:hypothetical protein [Chloroflexota bacterium]